MRKRSSIVCILELFRVFRLFHRDPLTGVARFDEVRIFGARKSWERIFCHAVGVLVLCSSPALFQSMRGTGLVCESLELFLVFRLFDRDPLKGVAGFDEVMIFSVR